MKVNTKKKNKKKQRINLSTSDGTDRKTTHDTPMGVGKLHQTMQSLLTDGNTHL
jgi:hypothetical protein